MTLWSIDTRPKWYSSFLSPARRPPSGWAPFCTQTTWSPASSPGSPPRCRTAARRSPERLALCCRTGRSCTGTASSSARLLRPAVKQREVKQRRLLVRSQKHSQNSEKHLQLSLCVVLSGWTINQQQYIAINAMGPFQFRLMGSMCVTAF